MRYIALDPGGTTGLATCEYNGQHAHFIATQCPPDDACDWLWNLLEVSDDPTSVTVIAERFTITPETIKKTRQHDALNVIGVVKWMCRRFGVTFVLQDPAVAKKMATNIVLRRNGMWTPARDHANDAARHLIVALVAAGGYYLLDG